MAFKLKSALKFGQKGAYKQKTYNSPNKQKQQKGDTSKIVQQTTEGRVAYRKKKKDMDGMLKEWLMTNRGFNQEDADRMIADGAYTHKDMFKDVPAEGKSPNKQEGPIPKKNIKLQPGEMEGTYLFGHNYGDEDIPGKGEGFEPTGTKDQKFTANERIIDLEERAGFLLDNDIPDLEGSTDPKDIKRLKTLKATVKKLHSEADIMRKRRENMRKSSPNKQKGNKKIIKDRPEPTYEGTDEYRSVDEIRADAELGRIDRGPVSQDQDPTWPGTDEYRTIDEIFEDADRGKKIREEKEKKKKKKGEAGPIKHMEGDDSFPHEHGPDDGIVFPKDKKKSPAKHGTTDDFHYGKNGHNPDIMKASHEDFHRKQANMEKGTPKPSKKRKK